MEKLMINEFDEAYQIMRDSFPVSELREYNKMKQYIEAGNCILYGSKDDNVLTGVILCWRCESCIFLENFAVLKKTRGKGLGTQILDEIKKIYKNHLIILEVEKPFDERCERRIKFYERNAFILSEYSYMLPQISEEINDIPLLIMSYPNAINENQFKLIKEDLFCNVYQQLKD